MGNRRLIAAGVVAIVCSLLGAPAAAVASPLASTGDDGLLPPIEIRLPFIEIRIGGGTTEPPADAPQPQPTPTATPEPTTSPAPPATPAPDPEPDSPELESDTDREPTTLTTTDVSGATDHREAGRGGHGDAGTSAGAAAGISRSDPAAEWPTVDATVEVGAESISVTRVRVDGVVMSALSYAAGGLGLVAAGAAVARWRLLARAQPTVPRGRHRALPSRER